MITLVILYTLYTLLYPVHPCLPLAYCHERFSRGPLDEIKAHGLIKQRRALG